MPQSWLLESGRHKNRTQPTKFKGHGTNCPWPEPKAGTHFAITQHAGKRAESTQALQVRCCGAYLKAAVHNECGMSVRAATGLEPWSYCIRAQKMARVSPH